MSRFGIALGIWFLFLIAGLMLAVWLHRMDHPNLGWEPGVIAVVKEKISAIRKKLNIKIKKRKKRS